MIINFLAGVPETFGHRLLKALSRSEIFLIDTSVLHKVARRRLRPEQAIVTGLLLCAGFFLWPISIEAQTSFGSISASIGGSVFGSVPVGVPSAPQSVVLTNNGSEAFGLGPALALGEFQDTSACGPVLAANSQCTISITFTPSGVGPRSGVLLVFNNYYGLMLTIPLSGTGLSASQAKLSSGSIVFPSQPVGTTSTPQTVLLSNPGSLALSVTGVSTTGDFSQTNNCGTTLQAGATCSIAINFSPTSGGARSGTLTVADNGGTPTQTVALGGAGVTGNGSLISAVWANEGGDKVTQDELRATKHTENLTGYVLNSAWNGTTIKLSGAHNEVISFNLVLEAADTTASNVSVRFDTLTGPGGVTIHSSPTSGDGVFNWVGRPIELFYLRYLQITGLSYFGYAKSDERQIPRRFQTPWSGNGVGTSNWYDRPDHFKFYPDIMVPLELAPNFTIAQGENQSIWTDIYIPKNIPSGLYTGNVFVQENGNVTHTVPVQLKVQNFNLPDVPTTKTMVNLDTTDIEHRFVTGFGGYVNWASPGGLIDQQVADKYFELFHRHKISLIGENECPIVDRPCASSMARLNGSLYTSANGYDGPGVNTPTGVFSIGTYGTWGTAEYGIQEWRDNQSLFRSHIDNWVNWFDANLPGTDYFIYLQDEPTPSAYAQVETWAEWIANDPGPGHRLRSMATLDALTASEYTPSLDIPVTHASIGSCPYNMPPCDASDVAQQIFNYYASTPGRKYWMYNDGRPGVGTFDTEDDGVSPRTLPWAQFKKGIDRWFYWYANLDSNVDWFTQATTWSYDQFFDSSVGWTSNFGKTNGDGVIVYPGTDVNHPADSYGVHGPFASLRIKEWRRGIQDADYLALANQIDSASTQQIINSEIPQALWEYRSSDPSWYSGSISWSVNPDDWESGRNALVQIISNWCAHNPGVNACTTN